MICIHCHTEKPLDCFYDSPTARNGKDSACKECRKRKVRQNREKRRAYYRARDRERANNPERVAARREYQQSRRGREVSSRAKRRYIRRNPVKRAAHGAVSNAIRDGKLVRQECEVCGSDRAHAHHDDYGKPLDVRWLCPTHHAEWHANNTPKCPDQTQPTEVPNG